jgi:precorrin-6Y C5,15-methyltransferase (decarboxylating)
MKPWLSVVGMGADGLDGISAVAREIIASAEVLVGGERHLAMAGNRVAERLAWARPLGDTVDAIAARRGKRVVVLATGDPMWFGIGTTLARRFARDEMIILPHIGAFSLAASRMGWSLADAATITLHGRPLDLLALHLAPQARLLILSENGQTPAQVAAFLRDRFWGPSEIAVLENLGSDAERRIDGTAASWNAGPCADLNTLAVRCIAGTDARPLSRLAGLPDDAFAHDGQLTKREVRAATLAALSPLPGQLLWDVGAGCGSISIEWMRSAHGTRAIAVERNADRRAVIARNAAALGVPGLRIVTGTAPDALAGLEAPDAIFVGGGASAQGLLDACWAALKPGGRFVANAVTVEGETALAGCRARLGGDLVRIAVSRAEPVGSMQGWRAMMPVTQWSAAKPHG